jgi:endonuclease G
MNNVESILRDDDIAREIAGKLPLLRSRSRAFVDGQSVPESFSAGVNEGVLESALPPPPPPVIVTEPLRLDTESADDAREAVDNLVPGTGLGGFNEAIVKRFGRPALIIRNDTFEVPASDTWKALLFPHKSKIDAAIPSVGRVELVSSFPPFIGTAWMVTKDIAVTNRHVALLFAQRSGQSFVFRRNPVGQTVRVRVDFKEEFVQTTPFEAEVTEVLFISEESDSEPDLAFIRLRASGDRPLPPPIPLFDGQLSARQRIAVIGYPAEDPRNGAADQARIFTNIFDVKRLAPGEILEAGSSFFLTHDCSTLGGNSGSPVIDIETGAVVGLHFGGRFLEENFAVRASTIREFLARADNEAVVTSPPPQKELLEFEVPVEAVQGRSGFETNFLGDGKFEVPLPTLSDRLAGDAVEVDAGAEGTRKYMLDYTHFSIAMHQQRRMAIFTASNIDGDLSRSIKRKKDVWGFDPRISRDFQIGNELYQGNDLDRGHLVRRLDPTWGESLEEAKQAELDTFFFTNCTPQHSAFNQKLWLELEEYLLGNTDTRNFKACVFTGPVFSKSDRLYRDVLLPLAYWKVAVMIHDERDELTATAYIVSQKNMLSDLEFVFGQFKTYQVPIADIERRTQLDFGRLKDFDPLAEQESVFHELEGADDFRV